jgi:hypothetical protein
VPFALSPLVYLSFWLLCAAAMVPGQESKWCRQYSQTSFDCYCWCILVGCVNSIKSQFLIVKSLCATSHTNCETQTWSQTWSQTFWKNGQVPGWKILTRLVTEVWVQLWSQISPHHITQTQTQTFDKSRFRFRFSQSC